MPRYRCYFVDGEDHIDDVANLEAHTLTAVIGKALALLAPHPDHSIEIWQSAKRVYRSSPRDHYRAPGAVAPCIMLRRSR
jgi:hypothetical protein